MERIIRPAIYVMKRDDVPKRPKIGKRDRFKGAFLIVEFHGRQCWQVHGSHDAFETASSVANTVANALNARMGDGIDTDYEHVPGIPRGVNFLTRSPLVDVKDGTRKYPKRRAPKVRKVGTVAGKEMADIQALHVRDIDTLGYCRKCEGRQRQDVCGRDKKIEAVTVETA